MVVVRRSGAVVTNWFYEELKRQAEILFTAEALRNGMSGRWLDDDEEADNDREYQLQPHYGTSWEKERHWWPDLEWVDGDGRVVFELEVCNLSIVQVNYPNMFDFALDFANRWEETRAAVLPHLLSQVMNFLGFSSEDGEIDFDAFHDVTKNAFRVDPEVSVVKGYLAD